MSSHCDVHAISSLSLPPFDEPGSLKPSEDMSESIMMAHVQPNSDVVLESESCGHYDHNHDDATTVQKSGAHCGRSAVSLNVTSKTDREVVAVVSTRLEKPALVTVRLLTLWSD